MMEEEAEERVNVNVGPRSDDAAQAMQLEMITRLVGVVADLSDNVHAAQANTERRLRESEDRQREELRESEERQADMLMACIDRMEGRRSGNESYHGTNPPSQEIDKAGAISSIAGLSSEALGVEAIADETLPRRSLRLQGRPKVNYHRLALAGDDALGSTAYATTSSRFEPERTRVDDPGRSVIASGEDRVQAYKSYLPTIDARRWDYDNVFREYRSYADRNDDFVHFDENDENEYGRNYNELQLVNELNDRGRGARRSSDSAHIVMNDECMPLQSTQTHWDREPLRIGNQAFHVIDQWPNRHADDSTGQTHNNSQVQTQTDEGVTNAEQVTAEPRIVRFLDDSANVKQGGAVITEQSTTTCNGAILSDNNQLPYFTSSVIEQRATSQENQQSRINSCSNLVTKQNHVQLGSVNTMFNRQQNPGPPERLARHLSNAWPILNHAAAQAYNPNQIWPTRINTINQQPYIVAQCSVATQTTAAEIGRHEGTVMRNSAFVGESALSRVNERPKSHVKLGSYAGLSAVEPFLMRLTVCRQSNHWSNTETKYQLICALTDSAAQIILNTDLDESTQAEEIIERLKERYGSEQNEALHQVKPSTLKQKRGESLGELSAEVHRLSRLAFSGARTHHSDLMEVRVFIDSLADRVLAVKVMESAAKTLDQACRVASCLEGFQKAEASNTKHNGNSGARVRAVYDEEEQPVWQEMRKIEQRMRRIETNSSPQNGRWMNDVGRQRPPFNDYSFHRPRFGQRERRCFLCGDAGHERRHCGYSRAPPVNAYANEYRPG